MTINRINIKKLLPYIKEGATLLTPNLRIKDAIISQYLNESKTGVVPTPDVYPIDVFIKNQWKLHAHKSNEPCSKLTLISSEEELLIWDQALATSLKSFALLNLEETASAVAHSYRIGKQWIDDEVFNTQVTSNSDIKDVAAFSEWIELFQGLCAQHQLINLVDATHILIKVISKKGLGMPLNRIVLVNFFDAPPLYRKLFAVLPNLIEIFTNIAVNEVNSKVNLRKKSEFQSEDSEANHCALWVKDILKKTPHAHIGIVAAEKSNSRTKLELAVKNTLNPSCLFPDTPNELLFNTSGNTLKLLDSGLIYDAFLILNLGADKYDTADIIRLLQSPFINLDKNEDINIEKERCISLAGSIRKRGRPTISARELLYLVKTIGGADLLASILVDLRTEIRKINFQMPLPQWSAIFNKILINFGWPGKIGSSYENSQNTQWLKLLTDFDASFITRSKLDYTSALKQLKLLAKRTVQRNFFNPSLRLSYFSLDEAVGLEFDYLWILGISDLHWPESANPVPFLPYALQKQFNIPDSHSEIQLKSASKTFEYLLSSTKIEVRASYHISDGEQEFRPSKFIENFQPEIAEHETIQPFNDELLNQVGSIPIESVFNQNLPLAEGEQIKGGAAIINQQSSCPFRAFATTRLKLIPDPSIQMGISKMAKGNACHIALEKLFEKISSSSELRSTSEDEIARHIHDSATKAVEFLVQSHRDILTPKIQKIEHARISALLEKFLNLEKQRPDFDVIARERSFSVDFDNLTLDVRIDRIDRLQSGDIALIDYKTGKLTIPPKRWNDERPEDMQLPLYYLITDNNNLGSISTLVIANINSERLGYSGISSSNLFSAQIKPLALEADASSAWQEITAAWKEKVNLFATEFKQGVCDVIPANPLSTCTYCGLKSICRIQELTLDDQRLDKEGSL